MNHDELTDDAVTDKIWDTITDSAKRRFDYATLKEEFPFNPDNFLFAIIMGLAVGEAKNTIALKLMNHMMMTGYEIEKDEILKIIVDNEKAFGLEVLATRMADNMLQEGGDPVTIYATIAQLLN